MPSVSPSSTPFLGFNDWADQFQETISLLQQVFQTKNDIVILTAPGSGSIEAGLSALFSQSEKVLVINNGTFAKRMIEIMEAYGIEILAVENDWGQAADPARIAQILADNPDVAGLGVVANETSTGVRNPVQELAQLTQRHNIPILVDAVSGMGGYSLPVDAWGLDMVCTSSNKALEMSPGLGIISVSDRAWKIIESKKDDGPRSWYLNLNTWRHYAKNMGRPYPTTPATSLILGLRASLKRIVEQETLTGHWANYAWAQKVTRAGLKNLGFTLLVDESAASLTVTTFQIRPDMENSAQLRDYIADKHNFLMSTAIGPLAENTLRFSHMGQANSKTLLIPCLVGIEDFVRTVLGDDVPVGASLVGLSEGAQS